MTSIVILILVFLLGFFLGFGLAILGAIENIKSGRLIWKRKNDEK